MAQPTLWNRIVSFVTYAINNPALPYNPADHDAEFDAAQRTVSEIRTNLGLIQRDDGLLLNGSVHPDALSSATRLIIAGWNIRGDWLTATSYAVKDFVESGGLGYVCLIAHTSGTFAVDLGAGKWLQVDVNAAAFSGSSGTSLIGGTWFGGVVATVAALATSIGASLLGFIQAGIGAVARSIQGKLRDIVSVKDFGALGDGVTDDTVAIQAAMTAAAAASVDLFFPAASYSLSNKLTVSSANAIKLRGAGRGLTFLNWTAAATGGGGIDLTYTTALLPPVVEGFTLQTLGTSGTALKITGPDSASLTNLGPSVQDVSIRGSNTASQYWATGINFVKCWYPILRAVNIKGKDENALPFSMTTGIQLTGVQACYFDSFSIFHVTNGILEVASGGIAHGEGLAFQNFEIVGVDYGFKLTGEEAETPGTNIGPGHVNSFEYGIYLTNRGQACIHNLLLYKTTASASNYVGIYLGDCASNHVHDNEIHGDAAATGDMTGIVLTGTTLTTFNDVHDNKFRAFFGINKIGINVSTGAANNTIHDNQGDATVTTVVSFDAGALKTNICARNFPTAIQTFVANAVTPSVGNDLNGLFNTANSNPTTVTGLTDGYVGQIVSILVNDANTTFQHNGVGFVLQGSANFVPGNGAIITFRNDGGSSTGLWREMNRRTA